MATGAEGQRRQHDFRPEPPEQTAKEPQADWSRCSRRSRSTGRITVCASDVEPVFGIVKQAMGFRQFLLGVSRRWSEWATLAYNCRRLHNLRLA